AAMIAAVACGRSDPSRSSEVRTTAASMAQDERVGSCDARSEAGTCEEYRNGSSLGVEKSLCEGARGRFAMTPCRQEGAVGACRLGERDLRVYYGPRFTPEAAKEHCESSAVGGRFE